MYQYWYHSIATALLYMNFSMQLHASDSIVRETGSRHGEGEPGIVFFRLGNFQSNIPPQFIVVTIANVSSMDTE
ncbi:hypothetical protein BDB00DRAFT_801449, partial [Zychaea mexicana]|uniref:uncharacterized protein n=1 Tax=Zychaea mexicana TaxID=64656 RepID=UPI0022FEFAB1